jgi:hypothetical protein
VAASQISRSISSSETNHGLRFEGILKIQFARKSPSKGQKPANSITSAHPISQPAQGIQNSSRTTEGLTGVSEWLEGEFEQAAKEAERSTVFHR